MTERELSAAVLAALVPDGLRERLRVRVSGGWTPVQVWRRLAPAGRVELGGGADPVAERGEIERVRAVLLGLADQGAVCRIRSRVNVRLNTKGPRDVIVDLFRLG